MNIGMIVFTARGFDLGERLCAALEGAGHHVLLNRCANGALDHWTKSRFATDDALVFVGAAGIAVRAIAPYIKSKTSDPAVLVLDETGRFVIPILSGHIGGANDLARTIGALYGAIPVITTATDCSGVFAVDAWASRKQMCILNPERIKWISARLLAGEKIAFRSLFPIKGKLPEGFSEDKKNYDIAITIKTKGSHAALRLVPPVLTLGVGCRRGVSAEDLDRAFDMILKKSSFYEEAVCQVCSIDLKAEEAGLLSFCRSRNLPFRTFSALALADVQGSFTASEFVRKTTGVDNVCERSAVLGSGGTLLTKKDAGNGITMAFAVAPYTVRFLEE
ncbi:cobalt-precorrin 5A hydrolase [Oscillospiraceae bacterium CM]|nr:cobalt-precorrin 5A hydrolase [Oscillospiraceae bacterium CM]